jgi:septal ring factor EnvC (AmiA/AmiB activator)
VSPSPILSLTLAAALALIPDCASAAVAHAGGQPAGGVPAGTGPAGTGQLTENLARIQRLTEDLRVTIAQTEIMRRQIEDLQHRIESRRAAVGRVAAATYRSHRIHPLYVLAGAGSQDDALRRMLMASGFAERQQQEIDALSLTRARYESAQRTLESLIAQQYSQQQALSAQSSKPQQRR